MVIDYNIIGILYRHQQYKQTVYLLIGISIVVKTIKQ